MFNLLFSLGMPFDYTKPEYWIAPSKTYNNGKNAKNVAKIKASKLPTPELNLYILTSFLEEQQMYDIEAFDGSYRIDESQSRLLIEEKLSQLGLVLAKKDKGAIDRFVIFNFGFYHEEFETYLIENNGRLKDAWFSKHLFALSKRFFEKHFTDIDIDDNAQFLDEAKKKLSKRNYSIFLRIMHDGTLFKSTRLKSQVFKVALIGIFMELQENGDVLDALKLAWLISYTEADYPEFFGLILYNFRDAYQANIDKMPFMSHIAVEDLFRYLDETNDKLDGITNFDKHLFFNLLLDGQIFKVLSVKDNPLIKVMMLKKMVDEVESSIGYTALPWIDVFFKTYCENIDTIYNAASLAGVLVESEIIDSFKTRYNTVGTGIISEDVSLTDLYELYQSFCQYNVNFKEIYKESLSVNAKNWDNRLIEIKDESTFLAENPLDNIARLQELSAERDVIKDKMKDAIQITVMAIEDATTSILQRIEDHNAAQKDDFKAVKIDDEVYVTLKKDNASLKEQLDEMLIQNEALKESKKELAEKLFKAESLDLTPKPDLSDADFFDAVLMLLDSKCLIEDVLKLIVVKRPWVVLSDKLIKSLSEIKSFSKPVDLVRHLLALTSRDFLVSYSQNGSLGTFDFFSKSMLSYKESETTMSSAVLKKQREFVFSGKPKLCEAHLKIGVNNTEQQQVRIHFAIEKGRFYLGYIGRHLQTGAM